MPVTLAKTEDCFEGLLVGDALRAREVPDDQLMLSVNRLEMWSRGDLVGQKGSLPVITTVLYFNVSVWS